MNIKKVSIMGLLLSLGLALFASCEEAQPGADPREPIIAALASEVYSPAYVTLEQHLERLHEANVALCQQPAQASLELARERWKEANAAQREVTFLGFGLYEELRLDAYLSRWPTSQEALEALVKDAQQSPLNAASINEQGANKRGLPAMEYLLFGQAPDPQPPASFEDAALGARRCELLVALSADSVAQTSPLKEAWQDEQSAAFIEFVTAGNGSTRYMSRQDLISMLVNHIVTRQEYLTYTVLGAPAGFKEGVAPDPMSLQGWRSQSSAEALLHELEGLRHLWTGSLKPVARGQERGLLAPTRAQSPELADRLLDALETAKQRIEEIDGPLQAAISEQPEQVSAAFEALQTLTRLLKTEWAADLGVTVTFNDNDGD